MSFTALFVSQDQTPREEVRNEKILTIFDRKKRHFRDKSLEYYERWKKRSPLAAKMLSEPIFRYADFPPMYAADMLAAIMKEEFERQLYCPDAEPTESYLRIHKIAERRMWDGKADNNIPFALLRTVNEIYRCLPKSFREEVEAQMKKKLEMKNDGKDFERFDALLREVVSVPKEELNRREAEYQAEKEKRQARKRLAK